MFAPPTIETRHFTIALDPGTGAICGLRHKKTGRDWASARQPLALFAVVDIRFSWFGKAANRMPEALWLTFQPAVSDPQGWLLDKSDGAVSPFDVVTGGNRAMHAVLGGRRYNGPEGALRIETLDAPVLALGERMPVNFTRNQPDLAKGLHFCLFNNGWGTNYVQWFGEDMRFRFRISV